MHQQYYPPIQGASSFHCPHCQVLAHQHWSKLSRLEGNAYNQTEFSASRCGPCRELVYWYGARMVAPAAATAPPAHPDLPEICRGDYEEARDIADRSPRAAAALLRLAVQKLMPVLGESGKNINEDIKELVRKGLPAQVQKALDYCQVVGNNAVHPGEIDLNDSPEVAQNLFGMINFIVDDRITRPREIERLYLELPEAAREAIEKRDK